MNANVKIVLRLLWDHVLFIILTIVFMPIFGWLIERDKGLLIFSYIVAALYFLMIYSGMWEVARKDSKPYSKTKPYFLRGLVLGAFGSILSVILAVVFYMAKAGAFDFNIVNLIYRIWMSMFLGFFETYGEAHPLVFGLVVLVLPLASFLGYVAGLHNFSIQDKIIRALNKKAQKSK
ncbi:MAG: hypothetical protein MJB12_04765 [Firmicutes bacterium]|nr:hypothetical protein [Bacillota bacterium]